MPAKRVAGKRKKRQTGGKAEINSFYRRLGTLHGTRIDHPMHGAGFWDAIKGAFNWIKDNKVISTVASAFPHPLAQRVGGIAGQLGFGRAQVIDM